VSWQTEFYDLKTTGAASVRLGITGGRVTETPAAEQWRCFRGRAWVLVRRDLEREGVLVVPAPPE
jgi:hypothetical protein